MLLGSRDRSGGQAHHDHRRTLLFRRSRPAAGAVSTGASGRFRGEISKDGSTIAYTLSYSGLEGTVEANITQSVTAPTCPQAGTVTGTLTAANLTIMAAGQGINEAGSTAADDATIKRAAQLAAEAAQPSEDLRGSVEYKRDMVRVLTARALRKALERAGAGR